MSDFKPMDFKGVLVETCMESGPMTIEQIDRALAGTKDRQEMRAVMSLVECYIGIAHAETTKRGQDARVRDEAAGAANYLKSLRDDLLEKTHERPPEETPDAG